MSLNRREFIQRGGVSASVGAAALTLNAAVTGASERSDGEGADAKKARQFLSEEQAATLAAFSEVLVPGAQAAGIVDFVDSQLAGPEADSLLMLRYLTVPLDQFGGFYQAGLTACAALAQSAFDGKTWSALDMKQRQQLVQLMANDAAPDWAGPPASFFLFVVRSDACDVVYGTRGGFERIGMPHMAHIEPKSEW